MNEPIDPGPTDCRQHWQIVQELTKERDEARAQRDNLRQLLRNECENFDGECAGTCETFAHDEGCRFVTFANDHRALKNELAEMKAIGQTMSWQKGPAEGGVGEGGGMIRWPWVEPKESWTGDDLPGWWYPHQPAFLPRNVYYGGEHQTTGIEADVCADIAARQRLGLAKYGRSVADNPLRLQQWLQHAYEECLDQAVYLRRAIAEMEATS